MFLTLPTACKEGFVNKIMLLNILFVMVGIKAFQNVNGI